MTGEARIERRGEVPVAVLVGEVDISRAAMIRDQLFQSVTNQDYGMVVDLRETTYLDSAGINILFALAERLADRQQRLVALLPRRAVVRRVVELVDLASVMGISETLDGAVAEIEALAGDDADPREET